MKEAKRIFEAPERANFLARNQREVFIEAKPGFVDCWEVSVGVRQNGHKNIRWGVYLPKRDVKESIQDFYKTVLFLSNLDESMTISEGDVESAYYLARNKAIPWHVSEGVEEFSKRPSIVANMERVLSSSLPDHDVVFDALSNAPSVESLSQAPILCTYFGKFETFFRKLMVGDEVLPEPLDVPVFSKEA